MLFNGFDSDDSTSVSFSVRQGESYRIVAVAYAGYFDGGPYELSWKGQLEVSDPEPELIARIEMVNGEPIITWTPDHGSARTYTVLGSTDLKTWTPVEAGRARDYTFFKVRAEAR